MIDPPVGFAHRGARAHAPENTLEAFALALKLGATGLESDVWITADGKAVLDHDGVVGSRLRKRPIASVDSTDLPEHIPTLAQLYDTCGTNWELSLDIKDASAIDEVVKVADAAGASGRLWLCHPDLSTVASWRTMAPQSRLVHSTSMHRLSGGPEAHAAELARLDVDAANFHHSEWSGGYAVLYHRFDRLAMAWDAQFARVIDGMLDAGIDAVFSDHVDRMMGCLARLG